MASKLKHCPGCGRGLSAKYRVGPHPKRVRKELRVGKQASVTCPWVPA